MQKSQDQQKNKITFYDRVTNFLRGWGDLTRALEATLIDNLAATVPWLAPVLPAYMVYHSLSTVMNFPVQIAWIGAAVVEFLGLSTVATTFQFWDWNDSRRKTDQGAPVWIAAATAAFYLIVVILVNVVLDTAPAVQRFAKALLSTLSVIAAITLAIRSQHARRLEEIDRIKAEKRAERRLRRHSGEFPATSASFENLAGEKNLPQHAKTNDWRRLSRDEKTAIAEMQPAELVHIYPISDRTAREWVKKARQNGYH